MLYEQDAILLNMVLKEFIHVPKSSNKFPCGSLSHMNTMCFFLLKISSILDEI